MNPTEPKRRRWCWLIAVSVLLALAVSCGAEYPKAKITVRVVDEQGNPVKGAEVRVGFALFYATGNKDVIFPGKSDSEGMFSASSRSSDIIGLHARKDGFYKTYRDYKYPPEMLGEERWEPWNPTVDLPLRRIGNPVPMYAREFFNTILPEASMEEGGVGYDLLVG
ncbi:MAG: Ig-like domain-containing protein, partial [Lentisphaeria bacterium]|nr:Ig-like domain-containing protein [Lentisphaeria bacterium]